MKTIDTTLGVVAMLIIGAMFCFGAQAVMLSQNNYQPGIMSQPLQYVVIGKAVRE